MCNTEACVFRRPVLRLCVPEAMEQLAQHDAAAQQRIDYSFSERPLIARSPATMRRYLRKNYHYYLLLILPLLYFVVFKYIPMYGVLLAFRRFTPGGSIIGSEWVGLRYFEFFISDPSFWKVVRNTVLLSTLNLIFGFPIPIVFALLLNEVAATWWKRIVQTISYLPRFLSTVVVVGMINQILSPSGGVVNNVIQALGGDPVFFMAEPEWFRTIYITSDIWQYMGWSAIIYLAALSTIDPQLYDSSHIDGASRFQQTWHITLPGIAPTIIIILILRIGDLLSVGFEKVLLMYNPLTYETADVISTFVYRIGIVQNSYSYATAVGLFNGVVALIMIWIANRLARRFSQTSLW